MPRPVRGFTLIELMVVVAVIAILAAIAFPSFNEQVRKGRRSDAMAEVGRMQLALERFRADNPTYDGSGVTGTSEFYTFEVDASETDYTITASPTGSQAGDRCGELTSEGPGEKPTWATDDCN